jgi:hypothetical protein
MSDSHSRRRLQQVRELYRRHNDSQTMLAVVMASIAALFIAGIAAAFIYAKDTNPVQTAGPAPSAGVNAPAPSANAPAPPAVRAPETTGSGGAASGAGDINRTPPQHDPREDAQVERPR